jgi:hypothetical protein
VNTGRRDVVTKLLQLPGDSDVAPSVLLSHSQRQFFGDLSFRGSARALGCVVERPLLSLHPSVPSEKCFRSDDGHDFGKSFLDGEAVAHQGSTIRFGQQHPYTQLAAQNLVLLPEEIVLLDQVFAEQLLDGGDQWSGGTSEVSDHVPEYTKSATIDRTRNGPNALNHSGLVFAQHREPSSVVML